MEKKIILAVFISLFSLTSWSQVTFQKLYGTTTEICHSALQVADGYMIMGGSSVNLAQEVMLVKTDTVGNVVWSRKYGGALFEVTNSIAPTYDGGFVLAGSTTTFVGPSINDQQNIYVIKVDAAGNLIWSKSIDIGTYEHAFCVKETFDHGFILTGYTINADRDLILVKMDSTGNTEWFQTFGSAGNSMDAGNGVFQTRDSGYVAVGSSTAMMAPGDTGIYLVRTNAAGVPMNTRHYTLTNTTINVHQSYGFNLIQNTNGNLVIVGVVSGIFSGLYWGGSPFLLETDSAFNFVNAKLYSLNTGFSYGNSVEQTADNGYILGGTMGDHYPMMIKTNDTLNTEWCYYYGNFGPAGLIHNGNGHDAHQTADGGFMLSATHFPFGLYSMQLIKTDSLGQSGCNQGLPIFEGISSTPTQSSVPGTVFATGNGTGFSNGTSDLIVTTYEDVLCLTTSLNDPVADVSSFRIYPNPANNQITIERDMHSFSNCDVFLYDIHGKLVMSTFIDENKIELNIEKFKAGVYFVKTIEEIQIVSVDRFVKF